MKEWTSRKSWKERKKAAKAKQNVAAELVQPDPELIFYGPKSGVVGFTKSEIYRSPPESELLSYGYDRVSCVVLIVPPILLSFFEESSFLCFWYCPVNFWIDDVDIYLGPSGC